MRSLFIKFLLLLTLASCGADSAEYHNYNRPLPKLLDSLFVNTNTIHMLIDKSDYKLSILSDTLIIKEYPVVFGGNSMDDKLMQGDECTPEGTFHIVSKYPHKNWSKFIWLNYPTEDSWRKHNAAKRDGKIPAEAKIGGEIGIHGVPDGMNSLIDLQYNWTLGCVSLKNKDVEEVYEVVGEETRIVIRK